MRLVVVVTLPRVVPVADVHPAVVRLVYPQGPEPLVIGEEEVVTVLEDIPRPRLLQPIDVQPTAVDIAHEQAVAVLGWPGVAEVEHRPGVRVPASGRVVAALAAARRRPVAAAPVDVVGTALD